MDNPGFRSGRTARGREGRRPDIEGGAGSEGWDEGTAQREMADRYRGASGDRDADWRDREEPADRPRGAFYGRMEEHGRPEDWWNEPWRLDRGRRGPDYDPRRDAVQQPGRGREEIPYYGTETHFGAPRPIGPHFGRGPKGYHRSDERLHEEICERLTAHPDVDASDIEVVVRDGDVTLTGTVDSRQAKHLAEDVVESVVGVREIRNEVRVARDDRRGQERPRTEH